MVFDIYQLNYLYKVQIINLGVISKKEVCELYQKTRCLIFPSTEETFGLALVEAVDMGLDVIAADLPYTHEAICTSFLFNAKSPLDCAGEIERYLGVRFPPKNSLIVKNSIEILINKFKKD